MVEEVAEKIFRIRVPLPGNPLRELNSYFLPGKERSLLIDTGFRIPECRQALEDGLKELSADRSRLDILTTHVHSDHTGLANDFVAPDGKIYMHRVDFDLMNEPPKKGSRRRFQAEGFPQSVTDEINRRKPTYKSKIEETHEHFSSVEDGDILRVGDYELKMLWMPGHTPGNMMVWEEKSGIMFTGDHVLFDITPNITAWTGTEDSLGDYLQSLERAKRYPVRLALPGHRESGDYQDRIESLLRHHERRLQEVEDIIARRAGQHAYEITSQMSWKIHSRNWDDFPAPQKWFAMGECCSHLDHLVKTGRIVRYEENDLIRYQISENRSKL